MKKDPSTSLGVRTRAERMRNSSPNRIAEIGGLIRQHATTRIRSCTGTKPPVSFCLSPMERPDFRMANCIGDGWFKRVSTSRVLRKIGPVVNSSVGRREWLPLGAVHFGQMMKASLRLWSGQERTDALGPTTNLLVSCKYGKPRKVEVEWVNGRPWSERTCFNAASIKHITEQPYLTSWVQRFYGGDPPFTMTCSSTIILFRVITF